MVTNIKGENTKIIAAFVVPVLIIAGVVGYQLVQEEESIDVDEGFAEMTVEYQPTSGPSRSYMRSSTATTHINDNSSLELNLTFAVVLPTDRRHEILIGLDVEGDFEEDLLPKTLEFRARGHEGINVSSNLYLFRSIPGEVIGCSIRGGYGEGGWGTDTATVGFDIDSPHFGVRSTEMYWIIPTSNVYNPYTLEIQAVVGGLSEEVVATVHVHIDLFSKIESLEASTDSEHYYTSDYTSDDDVAEGIYYVQSELNYLFENLPGGEDVLYDVEIYISSFDTGLQYQQIHNESGLKAGENHTSILTFNVGEGRTDMQVIVRFVIISQESNWVYDSYEDSEFDMTFTVTHDGGGEE